MSCPCCAPSALSPVPFSQFAGEVLVAYKAASAPATCSKMEQVLGEFGALCASTADINLSSIGLWLSSADCRGRAVMTRRSLLSSFRAACGIGHSQHYCLNPFLTWDLDRWLPAVDPEDLDRPWLSRSGAEISRVLRRAACEAGGGSRKALRTQALIFMAAYTGARAKEILGAKRTDIDLDRGLFRIRPNEARKLKTKGSRRDLPLHPELAKFLAGGYLAGCGTWLIAQRSGRGPWFHGSTGYRPVEVVQQLGERVAVEGLTLLAFRHTFATLAESWGIGELLLQRWLGHTRPETQRFYRGRKLALLTESVGRIRY